MACVDDESEIVWKKGENQTEDDDEWDDTALIQAYDKAVNRVKEEIAKKNKSGTPNASKLNHQKQKKKNKKKSCGKWKVGDFCQASYSEDGLLYEARIKRINGSENTCTVQYVGYGNEEDVSIDGIFPSQGRSARIHQEDIARTVLDHENHDIEGEESSIYSEDHSPPTVRHAKHAGDSCYHSSSYPKDTIPNSNTSYPNCNWQPPMPQPSLSVLNGSIMPPPPTLPWMGSSCSHFPQTSWAPGVDMHKSVMPPPPPPFPMDGAVTDEEALASMLMSWYMTGYHTGFYQGLRQSQMKQDPGPSRCVKNSCCNCGH